MFHRISAPSWAALAGTSLLALTWAVPAVAQTEPSTGIEEIIVTAQKREQNLQDVPVAVTAITPQALEANRILNVADLSAAVPNLLVQTSIGGASLPGFTMRGVPSAGSIPGSEKQVGMYVDGVYVGTGVGSVFDLPYIDQIEVVRGPQGTLFGQNSTAGAVSLRTAEPTGELGGRLDFTTGNYDQIRAGGMVNLPAVGPFSANVAYMHSERRGDIRNLGAGTTWDFRNAPQSGFGLVTSPKYLGDNNTEAVSAAVKFEPSGSFSATYKFFWVDQNTTSEGTGVLGLDTSFGGGLISGLIAGANPATLSPVTRRRPDAVNNWFTLPSKVRNEGHILTAQWKVTDSFTLKNTFGYLKTRLDTPGNQTDGFGGLSVFPGVPFFIIAGGTIGRAKQWSDEVQANYESKILTLTAGYLHYDYKSTQGSPAGIPNLSFTALPGFVVPTTAQLQGRNKSKSDAVYGQAEVHVTPQLDVVLGARYTWDNKSGTADYPGLPKSFTYKDSRPSYLAGVNFKPTDNILLYAKYSTAYVAGGSSGGWAWNPEKAKSWEAGIKSDLLDRRLRLNLTLFSAKYNDIQFLTNGQNLAALTGDQSLVNLPLVNANAGDAKAKGVELEVTAVPVERLTLGGGMGYTDFKFTRTDPLIVGPINLVKPTGRPKWTANMYAQYETPPLIGDAFVRFRVDTSFVSKYSGVALDAPALVGLGTIPDTWLVNARVALTDLDVGGHKGEIALWAKNLANNKNPSYTFGTPFIYPGLYQPARTYGVDLSFKF